ncbi:MAG: filamentous hemagglutinin N-terminal domain-containing protein, partial [Candidatus Omnitrophota bacterium]
MNRGSISNSIKVINTIKKILVIIVINFFLLHGLAYALPEGMQVESGNVSVAQPDAATLNITAADKSVINFNSFNIGTNERVNFIQPSVESSVLSRVTGSQASQINGTLTANGILFLTNPNGINFGATANVQVNSLMASTLDITTNNFINGNYIFEKDSNKAFARILNEGMIEGNNIALVASAVENRGVISARAGTVTLASGDKITVSVDVRGLIMVEINEQTSGKVYDENGVALKDAINNSGTVEGATVYMSAKTANDIFENAVNTTGIVKANGITQENGVIRIWANKFIEVSGSMITNQRIEITSEEFINVRGDFKTAGDVVFSANNGINVNGDITVERGNLEFKADADKDGIGAFKQASGAFICTVG